MLAATFAALGVIPILFLAQIAFIVAFGVLLDTFIVRSLLVPALAYDIGRRSVGRADRPQDQGGLQDERLRAPVASHPITSDTRFNR